MVLTKAVLLKLLKQGWRQSKKNQTTTISCLQSVQHCNQFIAFFVCYVFVGNYFYWFASVCWYLKNLPINTKCSWWLKNFYYLHFYLLVFYCLLVWLFILHISSAKIQNIFLEFTGNDVIIEGDMIILPKEKNVITDTRNYWPVKAIPIQYSPSLNLQVSLK